MQFTHEHREIQKTLKRFIDEQINPHVDEWEAAEMFPAHEVFKQMGQLGLLGLTKPEAHGGMGLDYSYSVAMAEALGHIHCGDVPMAIGVQTDMCTPALARFGSEELKAQFLAPAIAGDAVGCIGVSEPGAGSDASLPSRPWRARSSDNAVTNATLNAGGNVWFVESNGYNISKVGTVPQVFDGVSGVTAKNGIGAAVLDVRALGSSVTQDKPVQVALLVLRGPAGYTLSNDTNQIKQFAATSGGASDGAIVLRSTGDLTLKLVAAADTPDNLAAAGIERSGNVTVRAGGNITFDGAFVADAKGKPVTFRLTSDAAAVADAAETLRQIEQYE